MDQLKNTIKAGLSLPKVLVDKDGNETQVPPNNTEPEDDDSDSD